MGAFCLVNGRLLLEFPAGGRRADAGAADPGATERGALASLSLAERPAAVALGLGIACARGEARTVARFGASDAGRASRTATFATGGAAILLRAWSSATDAGGPGVREQWVWRGADERGDYRVETPLFDPPWTAAGLDATEAPGGVLRSSGFSSVVAGRSALWMKRCWRLGGASRGCEWVRIGADGTARAFAIGEQMPSSGLQCTEFGDDGTVWCFGPGNSGPLYRFAADGVTLRPAPRGRRTVDVGIGTYRGRTWIANLIRGQAAPSFAWQLIPTDNSGGASIERVAVRDFVDFPHLTPCVGATAAGALRVQLRPGNQRVVFAALEVPPQGAMCLRALWTRPGVPSADRSRLNFRATARADGRALTATSDDDVHGFSVMCGPPLPPGAAPAADSGAAPDGSDRGRVARRADAGAGARPHARALPERGARRARGAVP